MTQHSNYMKKLLEVQNTHQKMMNQIVINAIAEQEGLVHRLFEEENNAKLTFGQKVSDQIANFGGSWTFIFLFFTFLSLWMFINSSFGNEIFDPYPFILLNLILSCIAAIQAPIILMSQNRKEAKEAKRAQDDYLINLKSELETRAMDQKLTLLINEEFKELIEIQKIQIKKLEQIDMSLKKMKDTKK
jgi:uncharacterized membrane protein